MRELDAAGHAVTATRIADAERERIEEEFGGLVALVRADLFDPEATGAAVGAVDDLEAVVNLVGGFSAGPRVHETDVADFERMLRAQPSARLQPGPRGDAPPGRARRRRLRRGIGAGGPAAAAAPPAT